MPDVPAAAPPGSPAGPGPASEANRWIPTTGQINALVVFVQSRTDTYRACVDTQRLAALQSPWGDFDYDTYCATGDAGNRYQSPTEDAATEWPAFRMVNGVAVQTRPDWADRFIDLPGTAPPAYQTGSLSHFFHEMSRGQLQVVGRVYPHLVTVNANPGNGDQHLSMTLDVLAQLRADPAGLDFAEFDRYDNLTGQFTPDTDGDGEPDGDGIFDMLLLQTRLGQGIAYLGSGTTFPVPPVPGNHYDTNDHFYRSGAGRQFLGGVRVVTTFSYQASSGVISNGETLGRAVSVAAHEIGHHLLSIGHPCFRDVPTTDTEDRLSIMCGPRQRSMDVPDRLRIGWLTPRYVDASAVSPQTITLDPNPMGGDAIWFTNGFAPGAGDVLVEARTFASAWDGPPPLSDGDYDDYAPIPEEGLLVYQVGPSVTTPSAADVRYASMDNSGAAWRRQIDGDQLARRFLNGASAPRLGYGTGDAFTPLSRVRFAFHQGPLDTRLALTDVAVGVGAVTATLWGDFLRDLPKRAVRTNYTLDATSRARTDQWTGTRAFGGHLRFESAPDAVQFPAVPTSASVELLPGAAVELSGLHTTLAGTAQRLLPFRFGDAARLVVSGGFLDTDLVSFDRVPGVVGWSGLRFVDNARSVLARTTVSGVADASGGTGEDEIPGALSVYAGVVELDRSTVSGNTTDGVFVSGSGSEVNLYGDVTRRTSIQNNAGYGVVVADEGLARLSTQSLVTANAAGGGYVTGKGAVLALDAAEVSSNDGPGATAAALGEVQTVDMPSLIGFNRGGLNAVSGGAIFAGTCSTSGCEHDPNQFPDNYNSTFPSTYDARSVLGSVLLAEGNTWGDVETADSLVLVQDASSYLSVEPVIPAFGLRSAPSRLTADRVGEAEIGPDDGPGGAAQRLEAAPLFALASRHLAAGDTLAAGQAVRDALAEAQSGAERRATFEAAARLFALVRPPALVAAVEGVAAAPPDTASAHPWALRALAVARAEEGRWTEAQAAAATLAALYAGTEHGVAGMASLVSLAVEQDDEDGAVGALTSLAAAHPEAEATARAGALVAAAFPHADVGGAFRSGRSAGLTTAGKAGVAGVTAAGSAPESVAVGAVRPNPTAGTAAVALSLPRVATVEAVVYDALGRRVAVLASGEQAPGVRDLVVPPLPAGIYLVRVVVREVGAAPMVDVRRMTVVR